MRTYLFDLDGTLTDSARGLVGSFRAALKHLSLPERSYEELYAYMGTPLPLFFREMDPTISEKEIEEGMEAFRTYFTEKGIWENDLYPGVTDLLEAVQNGGDQACVVTSKPQNFAEEVIVNVLGIRHLLNGPIIGAGLDETDTKTTLITRALRLTGASRESTCMVGDRHYDIIGAIEVGVTPIGVLWGYGSRQELTDAGCRLFAQNVDDFTQHFIRENRANLGGTLADTSLAAACI